jgi:predicted lysophospholipase L1 biosynthesis ABC-type transport system permease subunit
VQHDALWRQRLDAWLAFGARLVQVLSVLLGAGAALVVGNTVRLDIQARREEIGVLQLLGASDGFIRRPFLYLGAWYGLGAGAVALALIGAAVPPCACRWPNSRAATAARSYCTAWTCCTAAWSCWHAAAGLAGRLAGHRPLPPPDPPDRHLRPACNRKR